ncbi:hypothetical protein DNTS_013776, partial [Danionella cerebrum]
MSGNGNPCHSPGGLGTPLGGFPMPHYPYFFPHMLGGLSPPPLPGLPVSGYSTPSPAIKYDKRKSFGVFSAQFSGSSSFASADCYMTNRLS